MSYIIAFWIVVIASAAFTPANSALGLYSRHLLMTATQFLNTLTGGHPDQSFSGRCGVNRRKHRNQGVWALLADTIDRLFLMLRDEHDHCNNAIEHDRPSTVNYPSGWAGWVSIAGALFAVHVIAVLAEQI
jgi:hypothetical protein